MTDKDKYILHVTLGLGGGVGTVITHLIKFQLKEGYRVGILTNLEYKEKVERTFEESIDTYYNKPLSIPGWRLIFGMPIKKVYNKIKKEYPEANIVIHAHNPATIGLLKILNKLPIICTIHGVSNSSRLGNYIAIKILKRVSNHNNYLVGVSKETSDYYRKKIKGNDILTIFNGINIERKKTDKYGKFTVGFISDLSNHKGWKYVLDAFVQLEDNYKEKIDLVFVGSGTEQAVVQLKKEILSLNMGNSIRYLGQIENAGEKIVPKVNLIVLPSISEGMPMILLEAIGNNIPILATNVGGIPEILKNNVNGSFIHRDPIDIKNKIEDIYMNPDKYMYYCEQSQKIFNKNFTVDIMGNNYSNLYNQILNG